MATIDDLPDSLLGAVLAPLGRRRAATALLVSKRWHRVFLSEPAMWWQLTINSFIAPHKLASDLALLRRVGSMVASLTLTCESSEAQAKALGYLQPAQLQQLDVWEPAQQTLAVLPRFSRLCRLEAAGSGSPVGIAIASVQLPHLSYLSFSCDAVSEDVTAALAACTQLRHMAIEADCFEQPQGLRQLTALRQLTTLELLASSEDASIYPPEPALLPALQSFAFHTVALHQGAGVQVAGSLLLGCSFNAPRPAELGREADGGAVLCIFALAEGSLRQLLSALRPGAVHALRGLELAECFIDAAELEGCTELAAVMDLDLHNCPANDGWEAALPALLRQAPLLSSLTFGDCFHGALPRRLVDHSGLRRLALRYNHLEALPAGPYLASLEQLDLREPSLVQLPPLETATALTSLQLSRHSSLHTPPLSESHLAAGVSPLTRLQYIVLTGCKLKQLPLEGWAGMSALQRLDLSDNAFAALPAALHQATALRWLSLSRNQQLRPVSQQLGALLSHLPLLEELRLERTGLVELPEQLPTGLRSLDISYNQLQTLPAGIAGATQLGVLSLGGNRALSLSHADVDSLLAHLPLLWELDLRNTATPDDVEQYASSRLFQLTPAVQP